MALKPLSDHVVVRRLEKEAKSEGGIVLPDVAKDKPQLGEIIAVGPGKWDEEGKHRIALDVKKGDKVVFSKYSGNEFKFKGEELLILDQDSILAVVEG